MPDLQPNGSRMSGALKYPKFGLRTFWVEGVALQGPGLKWFWAEADGCCGLDGSILGAAKGFWCFGFRWVQGCLGPLKEDDTIHGGEIVLRGAIHVFGHSPSTDRHTSPQKSSNFRPSALTLGFLHLTLSEQSIAPKLSLWASAPISRFAASGAAAGTVSGLV